MRSFFHLFMASLWCLSLTVGGLSAQTAAKKQAYTPTEKKINALLDSVRHYQHSDKTTAQKFLTQADNLMKEVRNPAPAVLASILFFHGHVHLQNAAMDSAQTCYLRSLKLYQQIGDSASIAALNTAIGKTLMEIREYDKAKAYIQTAIRIQRNNACGNCKKPLAESFMALAGIYFYTRQRDSIFPTLNAALQAAIAADATTLIIDIYTNKIQTFFMFQEPDKAAADIDALEALATKNNDKRGIAQVYYYRGYVAKTQQKYAEADRYYNKSLAYFIELKHLYRQRDLHSAIATNAEQRKDYKSAFEHTVFSSQISDSIFNQQQAEAVSELNIKYETEKKEAQIALKNVELATSRRWQMTLAIGLCIVILLLGLLVRQFIVTRRINAALVASNLRIDNMMRELHHRVKNNLQVVSSLFRLQARRSSDAATAAVLREGQARIDAMSILHQQLYQHDEATDINLKTYLETLLEKIQFAYGFGDREFPATISVEPATIDVDKALPIGLIVNELLTNSFKYAFSDTPKPAIHLSIRPDHLHYSDNGVGLPASFNPQQATSFGTRLITSFSQQLKGNFKFYNENGLNFRLDW